LSNQKDAQTKFNSQEARNKQLLETGGNNARVAILNTVESKQIFQRLLKVDMISKKVREKLGISLDIDKFTEYTEKMKGIEGAIDELIKFAEDEKIIIDPKKQKFSYHEDNIKELISQGKNLQEIAATIKIDESKVGKWVQLIESKDKEKSKKN